jgi:hypothetical protein
MQNVVIKKHDLFKDLAAGIYLSEGPEPHHPPPPFKLIHTEKGEGVRVEPERREEGQQFTKLGRK